MQKNLAVIAITAFAGWVLMPFAGIVVYTVCGIAALGAFVGAYAIISDIEDRRHERYLRSMRMQMRVMDMDTRQEIPQIDWRY